MIFDVPEYTEKAKPRTPLAAYNALQCAFIRRHLAKGGHLEDWCKNEAGGFRQRWDWILGLSVEGMQGFEELVQRALQEQKVGQKE